MKKLLCASCFLLLKLTLNGQPLVSPGVNAEICPEINIALQFNFGNANPLNYSIQAYPISGCTIISNIDGAGRAVVKFSDKKETHQFRVYEGYLQQVVGTYTYIQELKLLMVLSQPGHPILQVSIHLGLMMMS